MIKSLRLRAQSISFAAFLFASLGLLTSCSDEPLARANQVPEEMLLTPLVGRRNNPFAPDNASASDSGAWQGQWILNGHMLSLTATHLAPGQTENKGFLFGYSYRAKRFFMLTVTAGGSAPDSVNVSWFTIKDKTWRFMPEEVDIGGKAVERQMAWNETDPIAKPLATVSPQDSSWTLPPARTEMSQFAGWSGHWPSNTHEQTAKGEDAIINGAFDSKPVGGGYFLVWLERNDILLNTSKRTSDREVDVWGYSDVSHFFFRVNFGTATDGHPIAPVVAYSPYFAPLGENGLLLMRPLYKTKVGAENLTSRYGITQYHDSLFLFEQYLVGGINWTNGAGRQVIWAKMKTAPTADPKGK
jgi:hypothetical protein